MNKNSFFTNYCDLIRLNKPIGIWLLFLPCLFGIALSFKLNPRIDLIWITLLFFLGAVLMRSAGCIINDIFDRKFDENVKRTKSRPLASKEISLKGALIFLSILLCFSFLILLQLSRPTIFLGFLVFLLIIFYPLSKRFTYYPQIFLGIVFNFGILMAAMELLKTIPLSAFLLYLSGIIWTIIYDTIYAFQDIDDDLKIGVKSTAIKFKNNPKKILLFLAFGQILLLIAIGFLEKFNPTYYILIFLAFLHILCGLRNWNISDQENCLQKFKSNLWTGVIILIAIILG